MLPDSQNVEQILVIGSDALGPPETWVIFCLVDGAIRSFDSIGDQRAVIEWIGLHLPELRSQLERLLAPGMMENSEAVLYTLIKLTGDDEKATTLEQSHEQGEH